MWGLDPGYPSAMTRHMTPSSPEKGSLGLFHSNVTSSCKNELSFLLLLLERFLFLSLSACKLLSPVEEEWSSRETLHSMILLREISLWQ